MTISEIKQLNELILGSQSLIQSDYTIEKHIFDGERMFNFHQMADGRQYEGAFLIRNKHGKAYWIVLILWNRNIGWYLVVYPEKRTGPMIEVHNFMQSGQSKYLTWQYNPTKRDKKNAERKEAFQEYSPDLSVNISYPEAPFEVLGFLDELFSLAEARINADNFFTEEIEHREGFLEGEKKERLHYSRERNPKVVRLAKARFRAKHDGRLYCEACDFDFQEIYGQDYIEGHHVLPLSKIEEEQVETKVEDIILLCANCHRMAHRKRPWAKNLEEIKILLFGDMNLHERLEEEEDIRLYDEVKSLNEPTISLEEYRAIRRNRQQ